MSGDWEWTLEKYSLDQPRVPSGNPRGGQWTSRGVTAITQEEAGGLFSQTVEQGGFTYNPIYDDSPEAGYALSVYPEAEFAMKASELTEEAIFNYLVQHRDELGDPQTYAGGWLDVENGIVYLDLSVVLKDRAKAISLARKHNQEGIYDLGEGETIIVKEEEERRRTVGAEEAKGHQRRGAAPARQGDLR